MIGEVNLTKKKGRAEKAVEKGIVSLLSMMGCWVFKVHGHLGQRPGVPDILACYKGRFIAIEVKAPAREEVTYVPGKGRTVRKKAAGQLTELQAAEIAAIRAAGGIAFVAWSVEDVIRELEKHGISTPFRIIYASTEREATTAHGSCALSETRGEETEGSSPAHEENGFKNNKNDVRGKHQRLRKEAEEQKED